MMTRIGRDSSSAICCALFITADYGPPRQIALKLPIRTAKRIVRIIIRNIRLFRVDFVLFVFFAYRTEKKKKTIIIIFF